jgi:hypothetical protein
LRGKKIEECGKIATFQIHGHNLKFEGFFFFFRDISFSSSRPTTLINKIPNSTPSINKKNQSFKEYENKTHRLFRIIPNSLRIGKRKKEHEAEEKK